MNIAVTGCYGQLGNEMQKIADNVDEHQWFFTDIDSLDICQQAAVEQFFSKHHIDCCVNCAAYTAVDKAENEPELAAMVNTHAAKVLALACRNNDALLIHISTDYVFDGKGSTPYKENDPTSPTSVYGRTKLAGEEAIKDSGCHYCIVRTAWLYSTTGKNFVKTMLNLADNHDQVNVVCDQRGTPTFAGDLAQALMKLINHYGKTPVYETFHFTNEGVTTWDAFASAVFELAGKPCKVNPITTDQYPTLATRPAYSVLDKSKIKNTLGMEIPFWKDSLAYCIKELKQQQ